MAKMHENEADIDVVLVRRLIQGQFPQWADLPVVAVPSAGTDNALYRLGEERVVRLPRIPGATEQISKEQIWLSRLAPHLPLIIPMPLAHGKPDAGYPWDWSIYAWLDGENAVNAAVDDPRQMAKDLAQFLLALQQIDTTDAPSPGSHNFYRGVPLINRDTSTRANIDILNKSGMIDVDAAIAVWESALEAAPWDLPPVWIHGDLQAGNLLVRAGKLSAVIDFGGLVVGDPACDLQVAWNYFDREARQVFRDVLRVDDATWARGRGWALSVGVIALPYYQHTNPVLAGIARQAIDAVITDLE